MEQTNSGDAAEILSVVICPAEKEHLDGIVSCHMAAFPGQFTTLMGRRFLRMSYGYYIDHPEGICFVALDRNSGRLVGLVKGGKPELRSCFTRRRVPLFLGAILFRAITTSYFRRRLGHHFRQAFRKVARKLGMMKSPKAHLPPEDPPGTWCSLLSICTHPDARGRGVGKALMEAFRADSQRRGYKTMRLSVRNDNDAAIALYEKCGWQAVYSCPDGTYFNKSVEKTQ